MCVTRVCAACTVCHAMSAFIFFVGSPRVCAEEASFALRATTKTRFNIPANKCDTAVFGGIIETIY